MLIKQKLKCIFGPLTFKKLQFRPPNKNNNNLTPLQTKAKLLFIYVSGAKIAIF